MAMAKKRADKELQKAILAEHDSAPELKRTLRSKFRTKDRKGDELVSAKSFEEVLAPYALSERTLRNLKRRYELDGKVDYATFLDDAVALYVAVSGGGANSDGDSDAGRAKLLSDSDGGGASSDSSMSSANATKRKLEPTVEETLQGELEKRFSDKAPCERKLKRAWDQVTGGKEPMIGKTALSKILKLAGIKLNSDHLRSIHKAFCPKVGGSKRMDWHEFVSYCGVLHRGKRNTRGRRASARGSEIDLIAADLRAKIMDEDPDEIFDGFAFEGSEFISPGDFEDAILNIWPKMLRSEIDRLMSRFDKDDDNMISRDEFHAFLNIDKVLEERKSNKNKNKSRGSNSSEDEEDEPNPGAALDRALRRKLAEAYKDDSRGQMKKAFRPFDKRGVGVISTKQFKTALEQLSEDMRGLRLSKSDISAIAKAYARSRGYGKSEVKYNLFVKLCAGKYKKVSTKKRAVGDRVSAKCTGWTRYFEGEITKVNRDGTYAIKFDDGERQKGVTEDQIKGDLVDSDDSDGDERGRRSQGKKRSSSRSRKRRVGDRVEAKVSGWTKYFSGEITKVNSDGTYAIVFDDGEKQKYVSEEEIKGSPRGGSDDESDDSDRDNRGKKTKSSSRGRIRKRRVGERVQAKCSGWTKYFSGEIMKVNSDGTYRITFDDGETQKYVSEDQIKDSPAVNSDDSDGPKDQSDDDRQSRRKRGSGSEDEEDEPNPGAALDRALRRKLAEAYKDDSRGQMKKAFRPFDKRGVGVISTKQFKTALEQLSEDMRGLRLSKSDISAIAKAYARSRGYGKSEVKYNLFVKLCAGKYKKVSTKKRAVGDRVSAKCTGWTRYFEGEITKVNRDGTYAIKFDDGERQKGVTEDQIKGDLVDSDDSDGDERGRRSQGKKRSSSRSRKRRVGDRVEAKVSGWTKYFSGEITKVNSDGTYAIVFDDGEKQKYVSEEEIKGSPVGSDSDDDVYDRRRDDKASSRDRDRDRKHRVGDTVSAKCSGWTKYFSGEITKVNTDGTYAILFEDGERKKYVTEAEIQGGSSRGGGSISPQLQDTIDQMKRIYSRAVRKGRAESFREIFEEIDSNRSGKISASEFYRALRDMDMDVDRQDAKDVVGHFDLDRDGKIDYDEFLIICGAAHGDRDRNVRGSRDRDVSGSRDRDVRGSRDRDLRGNRNTRGSSRATEEFADDLARIFKDAVRTGEAHNLEEIFDALDTRKLGSISSRAFEGVILDELQVRPPSDRALREIMQEFDVDGDGRISIREFIDFCTKRGGYEGPIGRSGGYSRDKENVRGSSSRSSSLRGDLAVVAERLADALADQVSRRGARSLRDVFEDLDRSDRGFIELRDFERALENDLRLRIDRKDLNSLVRRFDTNRDGKIEYREFERFCEDHCGYRERAVRRSSRDDRRALDADRRPLRASRDRYDDDRGTEAAVIA